MSTNYKKDILQIFNDVSKFRVQLLKYKNVDEIYNLQSSQPLFFQKMFEKLTKKQIKSDLRATPPNKSFDDKFFLGFYNKDNLVAILDIVLRYPDDFTAFIGLFMVDAKYCGKGIGTNIYFEIEKVIQLLCFEKVRLGYVETNQQSKNFWLKKCGFVDIKEKKKLENYTIQICEKKLN